MRMVRLRSSRCSVQKAAWTPESSVGVLNDENTVSGYTWLDFCKVWKGL